MLRGVLAIALLTIVGGIAFYAGRATAPSSSSVVTSSHESVDSVAIPSTSKANTRTRTVEPPPAPPQITAAPPTIEPPPGLDGGGAGALPASASKAAATIDSLIGPPLAGLRSADIHNTFSESRSDGDRSHEAIDIMAPRGTPVIAVTTGVVKKLFNSKLGGLTVYQFDSAEKYCFYYAHLDRYAEGLGEGQLVKTGTRIGYVGSTGNADPAAPHLHFAVFELGPEKRWYEGTALNPYFMLKKLAK